MSDDATPAKVRLTDGLGPAAWAVMAFGRVQKLAVRADVADELACKWREQDPNADALPLYGPAALDAAVAVERERWRELLEARAAGCERAAENTEDPKFDAMARVLMSVREDGSKA